MILGTSDDGYGPDRICGAVAYTYKIGKFEVRTGQYCEFLNAVAKTDTYGLYNANMDYDANPSGYGCNIKRCGTPGNYTYSVADDWANRPVNYVSWGDSARFANWMRNGQPTGVQNASTTEDGSYYINGATSSTALLAVMRKVNATWVIPTEDEGYKSAYHKNDGVTGNYWDFPMSGNTEPNNVLSNPDSGNSANFMESNRYAIGSPYYRTPVGEFENSDSPYGTFDQGGNVIEWNEAILSSAYRGAPGGSFYSSHLGEWMHAASRLAFYDPTTEGGSVGFRVAYVPEPATLGLLALGGLIAIRRRRPGKSA